MVTVDTSIEPRIPLNHPTSVSNRTLVPPGPSSGDRTVFGRITWDGVLLCGELEWAVGGRGGVEVAGASVDRVGWRR